MSTSTWEEDQDSDDDYCDGQNEADTIQYVDQYDPFSLVC